MARPTLALVTISSLNQSWDADVDDDFSDLQGFLQPGTSAGFPIPQFLVAQTRPTDSNNDRCIIAKEQSAGVWRMELSSGSAWLVIPVEAATEAAITDNSGGTSGGNTIAAITNPADAPATADALRDDLVANTIPQIKNAVATIAAKYNSLLAKLKTADVVA